MQMEGSREEIGASSEAICKISALSLPPPPITISRMSASSTNFSFDLMDPYAKILDLLRTLDQLLLVCIH